ncbi:YfbM family protein [Actinoplanes sp. RD1]|uniref:YfbM family protein n=1 Tax=Actinoplanes sp. RD1 TaxID=3064538 RepID=UPI002741E6FD|nr:YfbM family protein [Actinoplanes sp. RD1]
MSLVGCRVGRADYEAVLADARRAQALLHGDAAGAGLDVDKAWHGIHYLLTGSEWEAGPGAGAAVLGGEVLVAEGVDGPPRLLGPAVVREVAAGLAAVDVAWLRDRFDAEELTGAGIYPAVWDDEDFDGYLLPHFEELREFYRAAAAQGEAVLLVIS